MTLYSAIAPKSENAFAYKTATVIAASILLMLSARISIPFFPVPMTMQTFIVIGLGLALGPRMAVAAVALYLAEGAAGFPVFAGTPEKGIGLAYMAGPTGGYLAGFLFAAFVAGLMAKNGFDRNPVTALIAAVAATAAIYVPGILWLGYLIGWDKPVFELGLYPFLYADALKAALAAIVFPAAWKAVAK